jgi:BarA-like signal transduction histidine kinase
VGNPNATAATVTLTYLLDTGQTVTRTRTMAPNSRLTVPVADEDALLARANVSTRVTSDVPVIVERAMYWPAPFATWAEAHNSFGVTETALRWGLAEGRVGGPHAFETYVLLANPNPTAAEVRLTFLRTDGTTVVKTYTVAPTSRFNVPVHVFVPELQDEAFGVVIEGLNGVPVAVERAMYNNDAAGTWWAAGTNATAVKLP